MHRIVAVALGVFGASLVPSVFAEAIPGAKGPKPPTDVLGWQKARWGMTGAELATALGSAVTPYTQSPTSFDRLRVDYWVPDFALDHQHCHVYFQMEPRTNTLLQVFLLVRPPKHRGASSRAFDSLEALLTRWYGAPKYRKDRTASGESFRKRRWAFPTTTVELRLSVLRDPALDLLTIRYFPSPL